MPSEKQPLEGQLLAALLAVFEWLGQEVLMEQHAKVSVHILSTQVCSRARAILVGSE